MWVHALRRTHSLPNPPHLCPSRERSQARMSRLTEGEPKDGARQSACPSARQLSTNVCHTRCLPLGLMLQDKQMGFSHTKLKLWSFPCLLLCRTLRQVSPLEELFSHIAIALWVSCAWAALVFRARCFGCSSLRCRSLKSGCPKWGCKALLLRKKLEVLSSLPTRQPPAGVAFYSLRLVCVPAFPTHFLVSLFPFPH